jgi:hypothetical protein
MRCFIVVAGGLSLGETRMAGVDYLSRDFALEAPISHAS